MASDCNSSLPDALTFPSYSLTHLPMLFVKPHCQQHGQLRRMFKCTDPIYCETEPWMGGWDSRLNCLNCSSKNYHSTVYDCSLTANKYLKKSGRSDRWGFRESICVLTVKEIQPTLASNFGKCLGQRKTWLTMPTTKPTPGSSANNLVYQCVLPCIAWISILGIWRLAAALWDCYDKSPKIPLQLKF